jgi:hypothetical protein
MTKIIKPWEVHSFGNFDSFEIHPQGDENGTIILAKIDDECFGTAKEKEERAAQIAVLPALIAAIDYALQFSLPVPIRKRLKGAKEGRI